MKKLIALAVLSFLCFSSTFAYKEISGVKRDISKAENKILVATYTGIIIPVTSEYLQSAIEKAYLENYKAIIIRLDTPGGLSTSMRVIIKSIMNSKVPVILYVSPSGASATSAGVFIVLASHVAVMSPGTNIGAAHPVMIGGGGGIPIPGKAKEDKKSEKAKGQMDIMSEKVLKDSSAYVKSIAQQRGRNVNWAIKAVTESDSISAREAVKLNVIDFMASDLDDLLKKLHNRTIPQFGKISVKNTKLDYFDLTSRQKFLAVIANPNVAMILMSLGAAGLFIEMYNPGLILPGVVGAVSLVLGFYSFHTLSANFAGVLLIMLGMLFFIAEIKVISYGLLSVGGIISVILGVIMLFSGSAGSGIGISYSIVASSIAILIAVTFILGYIVLRAQRRRTVTGSESLPGRIAMSQSVLNPNGKVFIDGEIWNARCVEGEIPANTQVEIIEVKGFELTVKKAE